MKKLLVMCLAIAMVAGFATVAFAAECPAAPAPVCYQTGAGSGSNGSPADPTKNADLLSPAGLPVAIYGETNGSSNGGLAVAIGSENGENSVGRASVSGDTGSGLAVYAEDYTDGNVIASALPISDDADSDSILITVAP